MKGKSPLLALAGVCLALGAAASGWDGVFIAGRTAEGKCFYEPNEKMNFDLRLTAPAPTGTWFVAWRRTGDDGKTEKGRSPAPLRVTTSLASPGFVRLEAWLEDAAGKPVVAPANPHGRVFFDGGAGVAPERLAPPPEPKGFDAWWQGHVAALAAVPIRPRLDEVPSGRADVKAYAFALDCPKGLPCTGWAAVPVAKGRYPLRVKFFGYNESWSPRATAPRKPQEMSAREIRVWVSPHGIEQGRDAAYYAAARQRAGAGFGGHAWSPAENASPDTSYFAQMAWRVLRGLEWAKSLPDWDGRTLAVEGASQGALQAAWAAAWDPAVTEANVAIVWNCDMWGKAKEGRLIGDWFLPWAEGLRWFDAVSHARRIPATCRVNVVQAGLGDYVSPPSGVAAFYNALRGPKSIRWVQGAEHSWSPGGASVQTFDFRQAAEKPVRTHAFRIPSKMELLRPGEVRPEGWLRDRCLAARRGYVSRLDEVDQAFPRAWNSAFHPRGKYLDWGDPDKGAWCAEGGAYWFEGLVRLAWELDDADLKAFAVKRLTPLLERMNANAIGFVYWMDRRDAAQFAEIERANHGFIVGASGRTTRALLAYYEATGDPRALRALTWCLDDPRCYFLGNPVTLPAGGCDTWRYNGDARLAAALENFQAKHPAESVARWPALRYGRNVAGQAIHWCERCDHDPNANWEWRLQHGVLSHESLYSFLKLAQWSGDGALLAAVQSWADFLETKTRQVHGVTVADEQYGWPGPNRGTETCTVAGDVLLFATLAGVTGEGRQADHVERSFFNAGAACVSRDWMHHVYFQAPNRVRAEGAFHAGPAASGGLYKRKHWPLCCTAALTRILPCFVQSMWMKPADGGLAAVLYAPNTLRTTLDGTPVVIETRTDYPFGEGLAFTVRPAKDMAFPLRLRIPAWCAKPSLKVNGVGCKVVTKDGYATLTRTWRSGDRIDLALPMTPVLEFVKDGNQGGKPYCAVTLGPLLMAKAIAAVDENTPRVGEKTEWCVEPATVLSEAEVVRTALPSVWDWPEDAPVKLRISAADGEKLSLVPYGCARLRVSLFPVRTGQQNERPTFKASLVPLGVTSGDRLNLRAMTLGEVWVKVTERPAQL